MQKIRFTDDWKFGFQGDELKEVRLPHDAMLLSGRSADAPSNGGGAFFLGGVYCYEKQWKVPAELAGQKLILHFEGVYRNATVLVNGQVVGEKKYGYAPFWIDVTDVIRAGEDNLIRVEADNSKTPNSRWYSGGGIYRPVWLYAGPADGLMPYEVKVETCSINPPTIRVRTDSKKKVRFTVLDGDTAVAAITGCDETIVLPDGKLWDETHPNLYTLKTELLSETDGSVIDEVTTTFGIRTVSVSTDGFFVNGRETLLRGGCIHSDNGILGAASYKEAEYRKAKLLKDAGFNAIRSSHNPASPALLEACDYYGLYVMDEGWDMWYKRKTAHDYGKDFMEHWQEDALAMVRTDYNHPSVVMYSIGNEVSEPATEEGVALGGRLAAEFKALDPTRPTTIGCNITILTSSKAGNDTFDPDSGETTGSDPFAGKGLDSTAFNEMISKLGGMMELDANKPEADEASSPIFEKVDIAGYNYAAGRYEMDGTLHPDRVIVGSETFPANIYRNWQQVKKLPYLIGDFMWTAIDYLGEVGIGAWSYHEDGIGFNKPYPWLLGEVGALDLLGDPTAEAFLANAAWDQIQAPKIAVSPDVCYPGIVPAKGGWRGNNAIESWSFSGREGNKTTVYVYSCDSEIELFINDKAIGRKALTDGEAAFDVTYEPGTLTAVSYAADGTETGRSSLTSAIGQKNIRITPVENLSGDSEITYVKIELVGENGIVDAGQDQTLRLSLTGAELLGFGSARARSEEDFTSGQYTTYYGRTLAAVRITDPSAFQISATIV